MALICCQDLCKDYVLGGETIHALRNVSFEIETGEFVAIMGPSGSGKSTLMNLLGALDVPTAGRLEIGGDAVAALSENALASLRNRRIGFVFQQFNLLPRSNALDNVKLPLLYAANNGVSPDDRSRECLRIVGLADRVNHLPTQLSGGQQQRVAIARALANEPEIILADEPTGALDTDTSGEIMALLQDLNRRGITVVVVTHDAEVATFAGRRLSFRDGRLEHDRTAPMRATGTVP